MKRRYGKGRAMKKALTLVKYDAAALVPYDAACRFLAEARSVDDVTNMLDVSAAMREYARRAKNRDAEADAVAIRMHATRKLGQMMQAQKATIGLAKAGRHKKIGLPENPIPTLAEAGIDKNLAHEARKAAAPSDQEFEQKVTEARDATKSAVAKVVKSITIIVPKNESAAKTGEFIEFTVAQWKAMSAAEREKYLDPNNFPNDVKLNPQTTDSIDWAQTSWPPLVGCLHGCPYCYARDITQRFPGRYVHGFEPVFRPHQLAAPRNTPVPPEAAFDARFKNVFVGWITDMFARTLPREWIEAVLAVERANPQWNFLHLTKFPQRILEFDIPDNAWMGTTVDLQARVPNAEDAFAKLREKYPDAIFYLSVEPMLEWLKFTRLDLFNLIIIGGASKSMRTPEWRPPHRWIIDLIAQADAQGAGRCKVFEKTNLHGNRILELPFDAPIKPDYLQEAPEVFRYLGKKDRKGGPATIIKAGGKLRSAP